MANLANDTSSRAALIANWVRERIVDGSIAPNAHLQEQYIADQFGSSRTPVREALKLLERERLILYAPNRGYVVRRFSLAEVLEAFDVRATLEGMACRLAAEAGLRRKTLAKLEACLASMDEIVSVTEWGDQESLAWFELNFTFHGLIISAAGNATLAHVVEQTRNIPLIFDTKQRLRNAGQVSRLFGAEDVQQSLFDHRQLIDAIKHRQSARAESLMREHVHHSREAIRRNFDTVFQELGGRPKNRFSTAPADKDGQPTPG